MFPDKLGIFVLSAVFAGFAGSLFACVMSTASPEAFSLGFTILIVMMVILGGMGNLYGPISAAISPHLADGCPGEISGIQPPHLWCHLDPVAHLFPGRYWNPPECQADLSDQLLGEKEEERRGETLMSLLSIEKISKEYDGVRALDRVSLHVEKGTIKGLIGPNGAGKSTLFHLISGIEKPDSGKIYFKGREITSMECHDSISIRSRKNLSNPSVLGKHDRGGEYHDRDASKAERWVSSPAGSGFPGSKEKKKP